MKGEQASLVTFSDLLWAIILDFFCVFSLHTDKYVQGFAIYQSKFAYNVNGT